MKRLSAHVALAAAVLSLLWPYAAAAAPLPFKVRVEEADGSPTGKPSKIQLSGCTVSYSGSTATVTCGGGTASDVSCSDCVTLTTETAGGYAASVSEAGPATTATALAANGANCTASYPLGVDASGAAESCTVTGLSVPTFKAADETVSASTTLQNDDHMTKTLVAGHTYKLVVVGYWHSATSRGLKLTIGGTATYTAIVGAYDILDDTMVSTTVAATVVAMPTIDSGVIGNANPFKLVFEATVIVNGGGTAIVQWAQSSAAGTTTLMRGSYFEAVE